MKVYLLRHGLSASNVTGLVTGTPTDELVEVGRKQAITMGQWLKDAGLRPDAFFVSPWRRARQTADLVWPGADWHEDSRLGETDAGDVAQLVQSDFLAHWPDFYADPSNVYPGGESHIDLNRRVLSFWNSLIQLEVGSVLLATHSGPVSCILQNVLGVPMDRFPAFLPAHASVSMVESTAGGWRIRSFSCGLGNYVLTEKGNA